MTGNFSSSCRGRLVAAGVVLSVGYFCAPGIGQQQIGDGVDADAGLVEAAPARFDGEKVVRTRLTDMRQLRTMLALSDDPWSESVGVGVVDFRIPAEALEVMDRAGIEYDVLIEDLQAAVEAERARIEMNRLLRVDWFEEYRTNQEIEQKLDELIALRPDLATRISIGHSLQGREIYGVRITAPGAAQKPAILLNTLQHAREWVTGMAGMWMVDLLIRQYGDDPEITDLLDSMEFIIIPVLNPDGYEYSWTDNRMWRKNLRGGHGVDLNRNWSAGWGGPGSSGNPSSQTYRGTAPFSEPCTEIVRDFMDDNDNIIAHIDIHSYSQLVLSPWGFTDQLPDDADLFDVLNRGMAEAMESVHGMTFIYGPSYSTIYPAGGTMKDWFYDAHDIISWTYELRDRGQYGFLLPPDQIVPSAEETWQGIHWLARWLLDNPVRFDIDTITTQYVPADEPLLLEVAAARGSGAVDATSVRVHWRTDPGASFAEASMSPAGGDLYQAVLPPVACGQGVQFYFEASTVAGVVGVFPREGADGPFEAVGATLEIVFEDDFADNKQGWVAGAPDDDATTGHWEWGDPIGTTSSSGKQAQPDSCHTGQFCWFTGQHTPGMGAGFNDVDHGKTTLFTPVFDLSEYADARVSYWRWYSNHAGANPHNDIFVVDISDDGGQTWVNAETVGPGGPETMGGWYFHEFAVSDFVDLTDGVIVRFVASDYDPQALVEAALDMFTLTGVAPCASPCPPDWNGDGVVDSDDLLDFLADWSAGDADYNGDGVTDSDDLLEFLSDWAAGC